MRFTPWAVAAFAASALCSATPAHAADDLVKQFASPDPAVRAAAAEALASQSPSELRALLPTLEKALHDEQWSVRLAVLESLARLGQGLKAALPAIAERLGDSEPVVQIEALHDLRRLGVDASTTVPAVTKLLSAEDPFVQTAAAVVLVKIAPEDKAALEKSLLTLSTLAKTKDPTLRKEVVMGFVMIGEPALPALIAALGSEDNITSSVAADALAGIGAPARGATLALSAQLNRADKNLVVHIERALGEIGSGAKSATKSLIAKLGDDSPLVRAHAARALGMIGDAELATPALIALTKDADPAVARTALAALGQLIPDRKSLTEAQVKTIMPAALAAVENPDPIVRARAIHGLASLGEAAAPALIEALSVPSRRHAACLALAEMGSAAKAAALPLAEVATDENPAVRMQAFMTLAALGAEAKPASAAINKGLEDPESSVKYAAVFAAGRLAEDAEKSTSEKLEPLAAQDKDEFLKTVATWALAKIHRGDEARVKEATLLLAKGLTAKEPRRRAASLMGLVELKPEPAVLVPAVLAALKDADPKDAPNVFAALAEFGPLPPQLLLGVSQPKLREQALIMLSQQKAAPVLLVPALLAAIEATEKEEDDRGELLLGLANYGPAAKQGVEQIRKIMMNDDLSLMVRRRACYVLGKIGSEAWAAQTDLEKLLKSDEASLRVAAAWALVLVAPKSKESVALAVPILVEGLSDDRAVVKLELITALGSLGPEAKSAVPALRKLALDSDPEIVKAATEALEKIQP